MGSIVGEMKFSVVIPYMRKESDPNRLLGLQHMFASLKAQTLPAHEIIVVEETEDLNCYKQPNAGFPYAFDISQHILLKHNKELGFNKSWCINVGIQKACNNDIIMLDAEMIFGKEYFQIIADYIQQFKRTPGIRFCHGYDWIVLLPGRDNPVTRIRHHSTIEASGGSWWTEKDYFFNILGGMNENYYGYGGEDGDLYCRAKHLSMKSGYSDVPMLPYPVGHYYHHWEPLSQKAHASWNTKKNPQAVIKRLCEVNLGNTEQPTLINMDLINV